MHYWSELYSSSFFNIVAVVYLAVIKIQSNNIQPFIRITSLLYECLCKLKKKAGVFVYQLWRTWSCHVWIMKNLLVLFADTFLNVRRREWEVLFFLAVFPDSKGRKASVNLIDRLLHLCSSKKKSSMLQLILYFSYSFLLPLGLCLSILYTSVRLIWAEKETQLYIFYTEQNVYYMHTQYIYSFARSLYHELLLLKNNQLTNTTQHT